MPLPTWRGFAAWSAAGATVYILALWGASAFLHQDIMRAILRPTGVTAQLGLGLIVSIAAAGFTNRKRPVNVRTLRNFLVQNAAAVIALLLAIAGFSALARVDAVGLSEWVAAATGATLVALAIIGGLAMAGARTSFALIDDEAAAEDMGQRSRLYACSFIWIAACGLLLIGLSLAGPQGLLSRAAALVGALAAGALLAGLGVATWRLSDELTRTLSNETGAMAFYLVLVFGGGWATLAHLGFVTAPAPLGWLTMFVVVMFVASFIVLGRRRLLTL